MTLVNFTNLDFDQIKTTLKDYLRSNSNFTDYDFEGSNLSVIIDLLAYNTYITSYNANMVSNEVFIDSATLRENVVSLARNIGYVPKSRKASRSNINFFVDVTQLGISPVTITLKKGIVCTSSNIFSGENYTFCTISDITVPVIDGIALFENIEVFEGFFTTQNFIVDSNNINQRYILENPNIDTSTIRVSVRDTEKSTIKRNFILSDNLFNVTPKSKVFFIQEIEDQRYELIFGDGIFGEKLVDLNYIDVSYIVTTGESGNGVSNFRYSGTLIDDRNRIISKGISLITTNIISRGGSEIETISSIKKYAPRTYASQNRAVTAQDYESIISQIYSETESVSVVGGEELSPPKYGKVFISVKPVNGQFLSSSVKDNLKKILKQYSVAGIVPEFIDLKTLYIDFETFVYFNKNLISDSTQLVTDILKNINNFSNSSDMNRYGTRFKYSKFLKLIDDSSNAITSNITTLNIRRDLKVLINQFADYEICYGNAFYADSTNGFNIRSSGFTINGTIDLLYLTDVPISLDVGRIIFFKFENGITTIINKNAGRVNYSKGEIILNPVNFTNTSKIINGDNIIEISAIPKSNDIVGLQDLYLQIDISKSSLNAIPDMIESGSDISGTNFITTSSYPAKNLIRN